MTVVAPVGFVTDVFGKQKIAFGIEIVYTVLRVGALVVGIALRDFRLTLLLYALASAAVIVGQMIWYAVLIRRHDRFVTVS
jgi:cytochrome c biogenesis protein CcdA